MARLCQIAIDERVAELYLGDQAWQIKLVKDHPLRYQVVGHNFIKGYGELTDLCAAPELPDLVKWAARGLPGIPQDAEGANGANG